MGFLNMQSKTYSHPFAYLCKKKKIFFKQDVVQKSLVYPVH